MACLYAQCDFVRKYTHPSILLDDVRVWGEWMNGVVGGMAEEKILVPFFVAMVMVTVIDEWDLSVKALDCLPKLRVEHPVYEGGVARDQAAETGGEEDKEVVVVYCGPHAPHDHKGSVAQYGHRGDDNTQVHELPISAMAA